MAKLIDSVTKDGERVISSWPGYLIDSHALAWPGLENHFGTTVADNISKEEREQFHLDHYDSMVENIIHGNSKLVISGYHDNRDYPVNKQKRTLRDLALMNSYTPLEKIGGARVFIRKNGQ